MIASKSGEFHRVCMDCKAKQSARVVRKAGKRKADALPKVRFVKQYTNSKGRIFRQYERVDNGRRIDIIMRDDRGYNTRYNYTQAEATAEARRRLA
jgi:hypothetical protein